MLFGLTPIRLHQNKRIGVLSLLLVSREYLTQSMLKYYLLLTKKDKVMATIRPTSVKLDPGTLTRLEDLAKVRHRTAHWIMREAISQYVDREEKREAFRQETFNAWNEYQETGLHTTAEAVDAWLTSWGGEDELPAPVCHK